MIRIQLSRAKGWKMPENTVKVDRSTPYGNPWRAGLFVNFTAQDAVDSFRAWMRGDLKNSYPVPDLAPLRGKNLACWCKPGEPCHADVLLELANEVQP